jgi:hypothetical protein
VAEAVLDEANDLRTNKTAFTSVYIEGQLTGPVSPDSSSSSASLDSSYSTCSGADLADVMRTEIFKSKFGSRRTRVTYGVGSTAVTTVTDFTVRLHVLHIPPLTPILRTLYP